MPNDRADSETVLALLESVFHGLPRWRRSHPQGDKMLCARYRLDRLYAYPSQVYSAGLAQLAEQRICNPQVAGSSPVSGSILIFRQGGDSFVQLV